MSDGVKTTWGKDGAECEVCGCDREEADIGMMECAFCNTIRCIGRCSGVASIAAARRALENGGEWYCGNDGLTCRLAEAERAAGAAASAGGGGAKKDGGEEEEEDALFASFAPAKLKDAVTVRMPSGATVQVALRPHCAHAVEPTALAASPPPVEAQRNT